MKKVLILTIAILGITLMPKIGQAYSIIYSNPYGTITSDGLFIGGTNGGGLDIWFSTSTTPLVANSWGVYAETLYPNATSSYSNLFDFMNINYPTYLPLDTYVCINGVGSYPTECNDWHYITITSINVYISSFNQETHIISITPANQENVALTDGKGATTTLETEYYVNEDDLTWFTGIQVTVTNDDDNYFWGDMFNLSDYTISSTTYPIAGYHKWQQEIYLPYGGYSIHVRMLNTYIGTINPIDYIATKLYGETQDNTNPTAQYHQYTVGGNSTLSNLYHGFVNNYEDQLKATSTGSTTPSIQNCNPFSFLSNFDPMMCLEYTFIPQTKNLKDSVALLYSGVASRFPLGYITNIYEILLGTNTTSLTPINATLPEALGLGPNRHLDLTISSTTLDYIWNATTSVFANESAPSNGTFQEIVGGYWNIFVYIATGFYILTRILGSNVIGEWWNDERNNIAGARFRKYTTTGSKTMTRTTDQYGTHRRISETISKRKRL